MGHGQSDVTVVITYQAQPGRGDVARDELAALIAVVVELEPDCRGIRLLQGTADADQFLLIEEWSSEAAFTGPHMTTPHLQAFMGRAREFLAGPPEIRFWRGVVEVPSGASTM